MKIAVIGSGGREHAIAWALARHRLESEVFVLPGNGGTHGHWERMRGKDDAASVPSQSGPAPREWSVPIDAGDGAAIERFCTERGIELAIVGPEAPLAAGLVDRLTAAKIHAFGPGRDAARLESSKVWAKGFMRRHGVATPDFWIFKGGDKPSGLIADLAGNLVLKYDGLAGGKGVWVCSSVEEANQALAELRERHGTEATFLIERRLRGPEVSIIGFTDGRDFRPLPPSQDHKRLLDGDQGPNTGGMGAFSPVPQVDAALLERINKAIVQPTLAGFAAEKLSYRGALYFGVMVTAEGPQLLEYNVRFGDPEAEVILPLLENDLAELVMACVDRSLWRTELKVSPESAVCVVLASRGYPGHAETGFEIHGLETLDPETLVFHSATSLEQGRLVTSGGRVLNVVARGPTLDSAIERVYAECRKVSFEGMQYRKDIGRRPW